MNPSSELVVSLITHHTTLATKIVHTKKHAPQIQRRDRLAVEEFELAWLA
jgi:hypothetical protein